ncbi:MAG: hypothetical protein A3E82_02360 [Gammaproteobacteria bacterium RIFCSPHIGHO2_12_FULL_38_11]|nr:MAG: hypothetical protein A3E82_02360 [Gammaproteobacteria bacterium RIFCSPHIGHO2_12_FULL_38_11]
MKLIYIDESGNTGIRSDDLLQPYHLIAALVVDDYAVRSVENDIRMLGLKHCGEVSRNTDFEFHGYEIHKGKGRYFSKLKVEQRIEIVEDLLKVIKNHNLQVIYTVIDKLANKENLHPHQLAFLFLIEHVENYLVRENALGLLIADENRDIEQRLIDDLERFKTINTGFGSHSVKVDHIIDSLHFVKSHNNHLIQLVDIVAYVLLRGKRVQDELSVVYIAQSNLFLGWPDWVEQYATLRQKTELRHLNLLAHKPFIGKEFPVKTLQI